MTKKWVIVGIMLLFLTAGVPSKAYSHENNTRLPTAGGNTLYVGGSGSGNYTTIQSAVNAAHDGDTVFVFDDSSPYHENVIISKSISLLGENRLTTIIQGDSYYYYQVLYATGENITISDFTLRDGIIGILGQMNNSRISRAVFENEEAGIYLMKSSHNTISDNSFSSCYLFDVYLYDHSMQNTIVNNSLVSSATYGIYLDRLCDRNRIEKNSIENTANGLSLSWSFFTVIRKNNFINNENQSYFVNCSWNLWLGNYWDDWTAKKPRPIDGIRYGYFSQKRGPWTAYDWRPAQEPYDIG